MRITRAISLSAMLALALTAFAGVASASASGTAFTSEASETVYSGYGTNITLSAAGRTAECTSELSPTGSFKAPQENLPLLNAGNCTSFGFSREMKMNGCRFEFQPGTETSSWNGTFEGTYSIGPAGCGPVTVEFASLPSCQLTIPAQTGLTAVYRNIGSGSTAKVEVEPTAKNLKYSGCGVTNGENGWLSGTWTLKGSNATTGAPVGISVQTLPHSPLFEADGYPITYNGTQEGHLMSLDGLTVECNSVTYSDTESGTTKALTLSSSFSGCTAFGFTATISSNGCHFVEEATEKTGAGKYAGPGSLTCPEGKSMEIVAPVCTVTIPAQSLGTLSYKDVVESGVYKVTSTMAAKGLTYNVTRDEGFLCPFNGTGTRTNGEYSGITTFTGKNGSGVTKKIRIGG